MEVLRRCPLAIAQWLVHCANSVSTAVLGQSHKDNVRCIAAEEQPEAKEVQLSQPISTSLLILSSGLRVQIHLPAQCSWSHLEPLWAARGPNHPCIRHTHVIFQWFVQFIIWISFTFWSVIFLLKKNLIFFMRFTWPVLLVLILPTPSRDFGAGVEAFFWEHHHNPPPHYWWAINVRVNTGDLGGVGGNITA